MKNRLVWNGFVFGIIVLFVGTSIIPSTISTTEKARVYSGSPSRGYIQGLIDNASTGDTIYIPSGIYNENIIINKSISLVGEHMDTTIIDGGGNGTVVGVSADLVTLSGFTIRNGSVGITLGASSIGNTITGNKITSSKADGISLHGSDYNTIKGNNISNNGDFGIIIQDRPIFGGGVRYSSGNIIFKNNFLDNSQDAGFEYISGRFMNTLKINLWVFNYWNRPYLLSKIILGKMELRLIGGFGIHIPWVNFDWRPALKPYEIGG